MSSTSNIGPVDPSRHVRFSQDMPVKREKKSKLEEVSTGTSEVAHQAGIQQGKSSSGLRSSAKRKNIAGDHVREVVNEFEDLAESTRIRLQEEKINRDSSGKHILIKKSKKEAESDNLPEIPSPPTTTPYLHPELAATKITKRPRPPHLTPTEKAPSGILVERYHEHRKRTPGRAKVEKLKLSGLKPQQKMARTQASATARFKKDVNHARAIDNLMQIGMSKDEAEVAFQNIVDLLFNKSSLTLNFNGGDVAKLSRLEAKGEGEGLEKMWDAPKFIFESQLIKKRDHVEKKAFGFTQTPYVDEGAEKNRPYYLAINVGNYILGAAPGYGGSYFVAKKDVYDKSTFSAGDTFNQAFANEKYAVTTKKHPDQIIAHMDRDALTLLHKIAKGEAAPNEMPNNKYIEAQAFAFRFKDLEKVVLNRQEVPLGSEIQDRWEALAAKHGFKIEYIDSKAYERDMLSRKVTIREAAEKNKPAPLGEEPPRSDVTKERIDNFLKQMSLVNLPETGFSLGLTDLRKTVKAFNNSIDNPDAPDITKTNSITKVMNGLAPFAKNHNNIQKLQTKHRFNHYVNHLKKRVEKANKKIEDFKQKYDVNNLTRSKTRELARHEENLKKALTDRETVSSQLGRNNVQDLLEKMIRHSASYVGAMEKFRTGLVEDTPKNRKILKDTSTHLLNREKEFLQNALLLEKVLKDKRFIESRKFSVEEEQLIGDMKVQLSLLIPTIRGQILLFQEMSNSIQADPAAWIKRLPNRVAA